MRKTRRPRLLLEKLERRDVPASVVYTGSLSISNPTHGALSVTQQSNGNFLVMDGSFNQGTYKITGGLTINGSNSNDTITVTINNGGSIPGSVTINGLNGDDRIYLVGSGTARIGGNLSIDGGYGNDSIFIGVSNATTGAPVRVGGTSTIDGNIGNDQGVIGDGTVMGGSATIKRVNALTFGTTDGTGIKVGGGVTVDNTNDSFVANSFTLMSNATIAGSLIYTGTSAADSLTLAGTMAQATGSSVTINAGAGANSLNLSGTIGNFGTASNFTYTGGDDVNTLTIAGSTAIAGNASITVGNATNVFDLSSNFFVGNNFILNTGTGSNNVGAVGAFIGGNASVTFTGNGGDSISFSSTSFIGNNLVVNSGSGNDSIDLSGFVANNLNVNLGSGSDTFTAINTANFNSATIDFGVGSNTAIVAAHLALRVTIVNYIHPPDNYDDTTNP